MAYIRQTFTQGPVKSHLIRGEHLFNWRLLVIDEETEQAIMLDLRAGDFSAANHEAKKLLGWDK